MDASKIKLTAFNQFVNTADKELNANYEEEINKQAGDELCADVCALLAKGLHEVTIRYDKEDGVLTVKRLANVGKKDVLKLEFACPCYAEPMTEENTIFSEFTLPNGYVVKTSAPKRPRKLEQRVYEKMTVKHELDAEHRTTVTIDEQDFKEELATEYERLHTLAQVLPYILPIYVCAELDGKLMEAKNIATKFVQSDAIVLNDKWDRRFLGA